MTVVGRSDEMAGLRAAVGRVRGGRTQVLVIDGEAGIGKTTMLDVVSGLCGGAGVAVVRAAAAELESDRPFGPLIAALDLDARSRDPHRRSIAALVAGRASASGGLAAQVPEARYQAVDAICSLVDSLADRNPIALLLDDLHWADEATLLAVRRLGRSTGVPLLLGVTSRPVDPSSPASATLQTLVSTTGATKLSLGPLSKADVRSLLGELIDGPPGPRLLALADGAGGNPLFLSELVAVLRDDGSLRAEVNGVEVADGAATADLARRLRARAARLGSAAGALVRVGAVLGTSFTLEEAARTGGWNAADLVDPLEELLRAGLLVDDDGKLRFRHDLLRRAIEDELPPTARRALHVAAGRALADAGVSPARIARHLAFGAEPGDVEAVRWLHRAAQEAAPTAPAAAVTLLDDALALVSPSDPQRMVLLTERVEALGWSGRNAEAESLARELLEAIEDRDARVAIRRQLALALFVGSRPLEAKVECERSAEDTLDDPGLHAQALAEGSLAAMAVGQVAEAWKLADSAVTGATASGNQSALAVAHSVRSRLLAFEGRFEEGLEEARAGMASAAHDRHGEVGRFQPGMFAILSLNDLDRFDEMAELLTAERQIAEARGIVWAAPLHHAAAANRHYNLGALSDAVAEATTGLTVAEDSRATLASPWLHALLALVAVHRGDLGAAQTHLAHAQESLATTTPLLGMDLLALAQARLAEAQRDLVSAAAIAAGTWDLLDAIGLAGGERNVGVDVARLASRNGDERLGERVAEALERWASMTSLISDRAAALYARARTNDDADGLVDAVKAFDPAVHPLRRARIAEEAAHALWVAERPAEAAAVLAEAQRTWTDCGATADARRASALFTTLGLRRPATSTRPTTGWEALTATERRVAGLLSTGAANAAIATELGISRRTVETHLRHLYAKVGVATRVELAVGAIEHLVE